MLYILVKRNVMIIINKCQNVNLLFEYIHSIMESDSMTVCSTITRGTGDTKYICYIKEITRIGTRLIIK